MALQEVTVSEWTQESVERVLNQKGQDHRQEYQPPQEIQSGVQYRFDDGTYVTLYETGRVVVQGRETTLKATLEAIFSGTDQSVPNRVFVVYGHDMEARDQLELILHRLRVEPVILEIMPRTGATIIERLDELTSSDFACVLLTPDDEGHRRGHSDERKPRARQNVVLELGMVLAKLGRERVAILHKGSDLELPSDISGLLYIPFDDRVDEAKNGLATALRDAGFHIQIEGLL